MPRTARHITPGLAHHVTQRGNRRQPTFFRASDYALYKLIAAEEFDRTGIEVWAYCLMPNHVHLIVCPPDSSGLSKSMAAIHRRYTTLVNRREGWSGCLWQGRFSSFAMDTGYLERCVRYVGLNPVRSGIVEHATEWAWSSVRAHVQGAPDALLDVSAVAPIIGSDPATFFATDLERRDLDALRRAAVTGRALVMPGTRTDLARHGAERAGM